MTTKPRHASLAAASASMFAAFAAAGYAGCSSDSSPASSPEDAGTDVPLLLQPPIVDAKCDPTKSFGKPALVPGLETRDARSGRLTANELVLYFDDGVDIHVATRTSRTGAFGLPKPVEGVNSAKSELSPWVSGDDRTLIFASDRDVDGGASPFRLYRARKDTPSGTFGALQEIPGLPAGALYEPYLREGVEIWFSQDKGAGMGRDLFHSPVNGESFGAPVAELSDPAADGNAVLSADGRVLYFQSTRAPSQMGDIWMSIRSDTAAPFSSASNVAVLNSASDDGPSWISADGCRLYFTSGRPVGDGGGTQQHLYVAERAH